MNVSNRIVLAGALALVVLSAGCLCCKLPGKDTSTTVRTTRTIPGTGISSLRPGETWTSLYEGRSSTTTTTLAGCNLPYIRYGSGCCLDSNGNGVCDNRETTTKGTGASTTTTLVQSTAQSTWESTQATSLATTLATTATTRPLSQTARCVSAYGVTPDTVLYLYTDECPGCKVVTPKVESVKREGYKFRMMNMHYLFDASASILSCFYSTSAQINVPQFICAGTGSIIIVYSSDPITTKGVADFADACNQSAY